MAQRLARPQSEVWVHLYLNAFKNLPLFLGLETVSPGHEHTSMSIITGQIPAALDTATLPAGPPYTALGNGNALAQWEYCFDRADGDTSRGATNNWDCAVPGSANAADPSWDANLPKNAAALKAALECGDYQSELLLSFLVEVDPDDGQAGAGVGLGDAVERFELVAAGIAGPAPEANYHDLAAVLGDAHVLAGEATRHQVGRRLADEVVFLRGARGARGETRREQHQHARSKARARSGHVND